uniref:DUF1618 domain-containing protein n=1 Tax=Oryza glaberrima TaxID=4538 RepID=I1P861_ORYGL
MGISSASYHPPTLQLPSSAVGASRRCGSPDWVMLDETAYISDRRNKSTAESQTSEGQIFQVSFWLVDPPGLSYFTVHCPGLEEDGLDLSPCDYFVYRAAPWSPWLDLLPDPNVMSFNSEKFGLFPCRSGVSEHYNVAFLNIEWVPSDVACQFELYIFSSKNRKWDVKPVLQDLSRSENHKVALEHEIDKLINIGHDSLGLVDLWHGIILLEKMFDDYPVVRYMTFPKPVVYTTDAYGETVCGETAPECVRDVACCNGLIKFVDVEYCYTDETNGNGWKATTWNRLPSWKYWRKPFTVDKTDILVDPSYAAVLPELWDNNTKKMELKRLICSIPTLSMLDDDFLYMITKMNEEDKNAWIISVDMKHNTLQDVAPISAARFSILSSICHPCAISKYLKISWISAIAVGDANGYIYEGHFGLVKSQKWSRGRRRTAGPWRGGGGGGGASPGRLGHSGAAAAAHRWDGSATAGRRRRSTTTVGRLSTTAFPATRTPARAPRRAARTARRRRHRGRTCRFHRR